MRRATISELPDHSTMDEHTGAVRSVQAAELRLPAEALAEMWSPVYLERLARTYWRFLTRVTLGLVRVRYTERERFLVLVAWPLKLIAFRAPEYELQADHGVVRWRIERGLLVARSGRGVGGHLQIDVRRLPDDPGTPSPTQANLRVEVEVANFHPAIASGVGRWVYNQTQSRIHTIVTHGFLRSLARLNLAKSRVGRFEDGWSQTARTARRRRRAAWRGRGGR
ncbi:MAG: hypothetical protein ACHQDY_00720 [Solirubrobacterales bacterium]